MSSNLDAKKERTTPESSQWCWQRLSPNNLDHKQRFPTAITLHRLVPHPPPVLSQADSATTSTYKYITTAEIKAAQIKARQEILASKQASPPHSPPAGTRTPPSSKKKKKRQCHHTKRSQSLFPCRLDSGEAGLRRHQLTRLLSQISQTLRDLQDLKIPSKRDFVTPLDLEIKRRHWAEYVRSMRRSLFALKQEVVLLEGNCAYGKKCSQYLRALAATARTLNTQLMALKSHVESSRGELGWREALKEFLVVARRVLLLAASVGVQPPPSSLKWTKSSQEGMHQAGSGLELASSFQDDDLARVPLLKSEHVRKRLASLATLHLKRKNKEGDGKLTRGASANKIPTISSKPATPKVSVPASQSLKTDLPADPKPLPSHSNISNPQLHHVNSKSNVSAIQPQPSLFPNDVSFPQHHQPLPPQNDDAKAPQLPSSSHEKNSIRSQPVQFAPDFTQQLSFLLERVCTIENNRRRTEALILEVPKTCQSSSAMPSLHSAVQQAKLVLESVKGSTSCFQVPLPKNGLSYTPGAPFINRSAGLSLKISEECSGGTTSHPTKHDHSAEVTGEATSQYGIKWLGDKSVTEQVRQQKEKFWLSLAKQGFLRPPETLSLSEGPCDGASEEKAGENFASTLKKSGALNELAKSSASRAELHYQTFESPTTQSQCSSMNETSSDSAHLNSDACNRIQHDLPDKHSGPSISAGSRKKHSFTKRELQQDSTSSSTASSCDSQSFPSYEGISSPD